MSHTLVCPECGQAFTPRHHLTRFCTPGHAVAYNNRQLAEGQRVVGMAKAWRAARNTSDPKLKQAGKDAFAMLCAELDGLNQADAAAGRVPALKVFMGRLKAGLLDFHGVRNR